MGHEERRTLPGFPAATPLPPGAPANGPLAPGSDDEPPSGVVLRGEVLACVPRLAVSLAALKSMPLDNRAGFIVSFIDGRYTIGMILDACAMGREEAIGILRELIARGVVTVD